MKKLALALLTICAFSNIALSAPGKETLYNKSITQVEGFFPRVDGSFVGDPMPVANNGKIDVYYLNDIRGGSDLGVHAFHLLETSNFYKYTNRSEVIPYINNIDDPELLLGTGSIIKAGDTYHAWYTAHNENVFPVESVMHVIERKKKLTAGLWKNWSPLLTSVYIGIGEEHVETSNGNEIFFDIKYHYLGATASYPVFGDVRLYGEFKAQFNEEFNAWDKDNVIEGHSWTPFAIVGVKYDF